MSNEDAILKGEFDRSLLDKSKFEAQISDIIAISVKNVYRSKEVIEKEIAGYQVITFLLNTFLLAVFNTRKGTPTNFDKLVL